MTSLPFPPVSPVGHVVTQRAANPHYVGVFVEGPDDVEMWTRWLKHRPVPSTGRVGVIRAVKELRERGFSGCLGIIDADNDRLTGALAADPDLIVSETHDHECDLASSAALDALLESMPNAKQALDQLASPLTLRDAIHQIAVVFGIVRWLLADSNVEFVGRLAPTNTGELMQPGALRLNEGALFGLAAAMLGIPRDELEQRFEARRSSITMHAWQVCNGHDVVTLLWLAFARVPSAAERCRSHESVGWALRSALDSSHLPTFPMWNQLKDWESRNVPWLVCRAA
jgi:hypothetical protein